MDLSQMSEEDQLQAALRLSMESFSAPAPPPPAQQAPAPALPDRGKREFPSKDPQDVLSPLSAKKPKVESSGAAFTLSAGDVLELVRLLFGARPEPGDVERWLGCGFQFSDAAGVEYGLWQRHGGPCGVFAPVQAFLLKHVLFGEDGELADASRGQRPLSPPAELPGWREHRTSALAFALATILFQSTPTSSYAVCRVACAEAAETAGVGGAEAIAQRLTITGHRFSRVGHAQECIAEAAEGWLAGSQGVLSFVCSVLLTRTLATVKDDVDDRENSMIGQFGHCSQELVNLMLIGEATSNVFDGSRWLGDDPSTGLLVRGIDGDRVGVPIVGFLSELEPMRYLQVGTLYKHPEFPLWVLGSPTHYTLLFSTRKLDAQLSKEAQLEQKAKKAFNDNALDDGGLAMGTSLRKMLQDLGVAADVVPQAERDLVREDIFIWEDFRTWTRKHFGLADSAASGGNSSSNKLRLFLYDGQDPPGPSLRSVALELSDIDPALAGGGDGDAFSATLHTRWPNAVVTVEPVAGAGATGGRPPTVSV